MKILPNKNKPSKRKRSGYLNFLTKTRKSPKPKFPSNLPRQKEKSSERKDKISSRLWSMTQTFNLRSSSRIWRVSFRKKSTRRIRIWRRCSWTRLIWMTRLMLGISRLSWLILRRSLRLIGKKRTMRRMSKNKVRRKKQMCKMIRHPRHLRFSKSSSSNLRKSTKKNL